MENIKINRLNAIAILLCCITILGNIGNENIRILGIVLTPYRVIVPLCFLVTFLYGIKYSKIVFDIKKNTIGAFFTFFFIFWIIYGCVQIFFVDNINKTEGLKELFGIALGYALIFSITICIINGVKIEAICGWIKYIYIVLLVLALVELVTRQHLYTSLLANKDSNTLFSSVDTSKKLATAIFYNPNDFATFLAIFAPLFLFYKTKKHMIGNFVIISVAIGMLRILDAWIAIFSIFISIIVFVVVKLIKKDLKAIWGLVTITTYWWSYKIVDGITYKLRCWIYVKPGANIEPVDDVANMSDTIKAQLIDKTGSSGSLRINSYIDSLCDTFKETFGLGYGPKNYAAHLQPGEELNLLVNPHCLWSEIITQYGVIIFGIYVAILVYIFINLIKIYQASKENIILAIILIDITYVFAAFIPSTFLNYGYSWLIIGISLAIVIKDKYSRRKIDATK